MRLAGVRTVLHIIRLMDVDDTQEHIEHLKMASEMIGQIRKCLEEDFPGILQ